ncbi:uncharacterized protein LOC114191403 [Vigna unguiculata]|uniref:uncharacterized protein LOC114191403 n=1 Tax=Vigna unguiculata TaxID=3917 RepID=UPI0010166D32|nr:uncharacterized protein LOC114191403 [Vigna unguiculata]
MRDTRRNLNPPLKRVDKRYSPYVAATSLSRPRRGMGARQSSAKIGTQTEALANKDISKDLKWPDPTNRILGRNIKEWCEFHRTYGHHTEQCVTLASQLQRLRRGTTGEKPTLAETQPAEKSDHVSPVFADLNTIAGGFSGGGSTSASRKRYARGAIMTTTFVPRKSTPVISFTDEDRADVVPHEDDPVVISVIAMGRWVHQVLVDQGSSADVLFWDAFAGLGVPMDQLRPFDGVLVGFAGDSVEVRGYTDLRTTFSDGEAAKTITVRYIVVKSTSSYNVLLGRPSLNRLEAVVSTAHLKVKFPTERGQVVTLRVDQAVVRKCYENSLKVRRPMYALSLCGSRGESFADFDPRVGVEDKRPQPVGEVEEIGLDVDKKVKIGGGLDPTFQAELIKVLQKHSSSFAWSVEDMVGIDHSVITHRLNVDPNAKPRIQRRRKMAPEKLVAVREETKKLLTARHIREIQYPEWLANVVMVRKSNGKWRMCVDFSDLNSVCPKDSYPLPSIDMLVDNASDCGLLSFMDAYSGYNQIGMHPEDEEKTAFMGEAATYCYRVMPFGLKNAGATYQRLMDRILKPLPKRKVQAYVDDMVVASTTAAAHAADLEELFVTINKYGLKLNPDKCVFGVKAGKFLGFLLTERGIETNPDKCAAILSMRSPTNVKEVQRLTGRIATLSRFLPRAGDQGHPYFECLRKGKGFQWTDECEKAFQQLKEQLGCPPILCRPVIGKPLKLYVTVTDQAISAALMQDQEKEQRLIYFVSKTLRGAEARYQKIEKVALAVIFSTRRLRHYFQAHSVSVMTDQPIKQILQKPEVSGRLAKWAIELSEYDISFEPRGPIKAQVLSDFLAELTPSPAQHEAPEATWILSVDGASNSKGSGAGIILENPQGALIEQSLHFAFRASNNQAEYEALVAGMLLAKELGIYNLLAKSDSLLVTGQVSGEFQAKDPLLSRYLDVVHTLAAHFRSFKLIHVPREQNSRADLLSKLASFSRPGRQRSVIRETLVTPRVSEVESDVQVCALGVMATGQEQSGSWMTPYIVYLADGHLPEDQAVAQVIKKNAARYTLIDGKLFRRSFSRPLLICVASEVGRRLITELHEGTCGSHVGGRALSLRVLRAGYYWPTLKADCQEHVKKCSQCQVHADIHRAPPEELHSISTPWPFHTWGIDILGPFPIATRQRKFLIVAIEYFTKWIEADPVATISANMVKAFLWKRIICRFGVPNRLISDNGTQFTASSVRDACKAWGIRQVFTSVEHPQTNGQTEAANRVILRALRRRVTTAKSVWPEELPGILLAYHTTPQSTTRETPFSLVYGTDAVLPLEIGQPSFRVRTFSIALTEDGTRANLDLLDEVRDAARITSEAMKRRVEARYKSKVVPRSFVRSDLVLRRAHPLQIEDKLSPKWTGPFRIKQVLPKGAYVLETLDGLEIPRTWNAASLRFYFS